jgi:glycosyltransferase involved in cell wall biosynthesis
VLAVSESLKDTLLIDHGIIDANKLAVSPIGVDTNKIQFADASNRPNQNVIISTRAHAPVYDQVTLIAAARLLLASGEKFKIIFASDRRVECTEKLVKGTELEPYVEFLHGYRSEEISLILANADVYVSSSKSDGTSQSLLEAMSSGVFPIVSDIIANAPWVSDGENGYIFRVGDSEQLANKLKAAFTKEELRKQAAIKNRRLVEEKGDLFRLGSNVMNKVTNALTSGESRP